MGKADKSYCLIFKDPLDNFKWTREFFSSKVEAEMVLAQLPKEAEAFLRQYAVVSIGGKYLFYTLCEAENEVSKLRAKGENPAITILNPNFSGPPELLYTEFTDE